MRKIVKIIGSIVGLGVITWLLILGYNNIDWIKVEPWIEKILTAIKNGGDIYFGLFFLVIIVYLIWSVVYFRKNPEQFTDDLWKIRKTFYLLYVILTSIGVVLAYIDFRDWKILTQLTGIVVFIDIAVFLTPNITKIWSAEFQHRGNIKKAIEGNVEFIDSATMKIKVLSEIIKQTDSYFEPKSNNLQNWKSYHQELKQFIGLYTSKFRFKIDLFPLRVGEDDEETKENISQSLKSIETLHFYKIEDVSGKNNEPSLRTQITEKLLNGESPILEPDKLIVIPIYERKSLLITVKASDTAKVDEIDVTHIVNLVRIFNWYM